MGKTYFVHVRRFFQIWRQVPAYFISIQEPYSYKLYRQDRPDLLLREMIFPDMLKLQPASHP